MWIKNLKRRLLCSVSAQIQNNESFLTQAIHISHKVDTSLCLDFTSKQHKNVLSKSTCYLVSSGCYHLCIKIDGHDKVCRRPMIPDSPELVARSRENWRKIVIKKNCFPDDMFELKALKSCEVHPRCSFWARREILKWSWAGTFWESLKLTTEKRSMLQAL